jgi:hypothetical protein
MLDMIRRLTKKPFVADTAQGPEHRSSGTSGETGQVFGFTLPVAASDSPIRLHIYCPPRRKTDPLDHHQVAIFLSLHPMGDVRAEIGLSPEGLQVTLRLSEENALQWVSKYRVTLESALASLAPTVRVNAHRHALGSSTAAESPPWSDAASDTRVSVHA